jgi:hypothetical protein
MGSPKFPMMAQVRQDFAVNPPLDLHNALESGIKPILSRTRPGASIAVGVGSRGISNLSSIVRSVLEILQTAGAMPFIFPAMGSHGGATPRGQTEVLASYGITEASMGVPIRASMEVREIGFAECGARVFGSIAALEADHIILINRIKPHTDFFGSLGSGLVKMSVIGLGKKVGAESMHGAASRLGHERVIRDMARVALAKTPILCGVAILEDPRHATAALEVIPAAEIEAREGPLLERARELMPRLPFEEIDLLIVDRIGKNISGAGLDPNVIGRGVNGYLSSLAREGRSAPFIRRIFVRNLTPETHGNAIGIGMADITTTRAVKSIDLNITYTNALTALTPQSAKIPIYFDTDRECIQRALASLAIEDSSAARVVRIADTLNLQNIEISQSLAAETHSGLIVESAHEPMLFDSDGNLCKDIPVA